MPKCKYDKAYDKAKASGKSNQEAAIAGMNAEVGIKFANKTWTLTKK